MADSVSGSLRLPVGRSWLQSASSVMSRVAGCARHAPAGERAFSRAGVVRKLAVYGAAFLAGFVPGWAFLYDQEEQWVRDRCILFLLVGLFSVFAMWWFLGRFESRGGASGVLVPGADDAADALLGGGVRRDYRRVSGCDALGVRVGGCAGGGRDNLAAVCVGSCAWPCGGVGCFCCVVRGAVVDGVPIVRGLSIVMPALVRGGGSNGRFVVSAGPVGD